MSTAIKERTRAEIEAKLATMGDYVRMDYLQRALKSEIDFETKKFVLLRLAKIYEERKIYSEAGKLMRIAADINTTFKGKIQDYMKAMDYFVKGSNYHEADLTFASALALGNEREKIEIKKSYKDYYLAQGKMFLSMDQRSSARKTYEKILGSIELSPIEKSEIQKTLLQLYERLGAVREYQNLKKVM